MAGMFGMGLKTMKRGFFDREKVLRAVDRATMRVLSKFGAFVRRNVIRNKLRRRKGVSRPGRPPSVHTTPGLRMVLFAYDFRTRSVVIGPLKFHERSPYGPTTVPELIECGGTVPAGPRGRSADYAPRPFMGPAYREELEKMPPLWRNSVR